MPLNRTLHQALIMAALILAPRSLAFFGSGGCFRGADTAAGTGIGTLSSQLSLSASTSAASSSPRRRRPLPSIFTLKGGAPAVLFARGGSSGESGAGHSHLPLPPSVEGRRREDLAAALASVLSACRATRLVQPSRSGGIGTLSKADASPVTVGDFASQACCLRTLHRRFPDDAFVAEEGSEALRKNDELLEEVRRAIEGAGRGALEREGLLRAIDLGRHAHGERRPRRVWVLDPIDGTKGFLRGRVEGGQYCVALALIEDGIPVLSVLGCPNMPTSAVEASRAAADPLAPYGAWSEEETREAVRDSSIPFSEARGCLFAAVRGCGCYDIPLHSLEGFGRGWAGDEEDEGGTSARAWRRLRATPADGSSRLPSDARFCLGVERGFSDPAGAIPKIAGIVCGPGSLVFDDDSTVDMKDALRMDGQGKYGILARGEAEYFLRLPRAGHVDWVWDVAPGWLVLDEAGGRMTDVSGDPIDFSMIGIEGRAKLPDSVRGVLGSCGGKFHEALVDAYAKVERMTD